MHKKSLAIEVKLGREEGMASDFGNLGAIYGMRNQLELAEEMLKNSRAINEKLGNKLRMARQYGNLGLIYLKRGELGRAEETLKKALTMYVEA